MIDETHIQACMRSDRHLDSIAGPGSGHTGPVGQDEMEDEN